MKALPKPVVALLVAVLFAVSVAVIALVFAVVNQGKPQTRPADPGAVAVAPQPPAEETARPQSESPPQVASQQSRPRPTPRRTRPKSPLDRQPDKPAPEQTDTPTDGNTGNPAVVTLDGNEARVSIRAKPGTSSGTVPLAAMARAKSMQLTEGQRAAVDQFETAFQQVIDVQLERQRTAMEQAAEGLRQAHASGDKPLITQAEAKLQEATKAQAGEMQQLNREYLDGIRQYLNDDQVKTLEKTINRSGQAWGYAVFQPDDDVPQVTILQPSVKVEPPESPPEEKPEPSYP